MWRLFAFPESRLCRLRTDPHRGVVTHDSWVTRFSPVTAVARAVGARGMAAVEAAGVGCRASLGEVASAVPWVVLAAAPAATGVWGAREVTAARWERLGALVASR